MSNTETTSQTHAARGHACLRVAVCAITFRRPEWLEKLLRGIAALNFCHTQPEVRVVIVENEADGPGKQVCDRLRPEYPFPLEHYVEPRRGIPFARNTAIERAGEVDFIAFIDDDEVPEPGWLDELLRVQAEYGAEIVGGPVLSEFEQPPPSWIIQGKFHDHPRFPTGTKGCRVATNNVLIGRSALNDVGKPFDESRVLTGGTDTHLFTRLRRAGFNAVWADEAVVHETVPESRCTVRWIAARTFRTGITYGSIAREMGRGAKPFLQTTRSGMRHFGVGAAFVPLSVVRGKYALVTGISHVARGVGIFCGYFGVRYNEYRRIHGK